MTTEHEACKSCDKTLVCLAGTHYFSVMCQVCWKAFMLNLNGVECFGGAKRFQVSKDCRLYDDSTILDSGYHTTVDLRDRTREVVNEVIQSQVDWFRDPVFNHNDSHATPELFVGRIGRDMCESCASTVAHKIVRKLQAGEK